jgi:predicted acetyltransferase
MNKSESQFANVEITPASLEQKPLLANLLELYIHDFCDFIEVEIGLDGRFGYRELDAYWTDPQRFPFLLYVGKRPAGFALIKATHLDSSGPMLWDMADFFILRGYRRRGIATRAAHDLWRRFPGHWQVRVMSANEPAHRFWHRAIRRSAGDQFLVTGFNQDGNDWHRFSFESGPGLTLRPSPICWPEAGAAQPTGRAFPPAPGSGPRRTSTHIPVSPYSPDLPGRFRPAPSGGNQPS